MGTPVATTQLTFDDEFDTFNNSPNGTTGWETRLPYYGEAARNLSATDEIEYYSDSSVGVNPFTDTNGVLSITAAPGSNPINAPYDSGAITTYKSIAQEYGYFEIRAEMPAGKGLWSAFWMAPQSLDGESELDNVELLGNNPKQLYSTTHTLINGVFTPYLQQIAVPDASAAFHTYGVDWEPTKITWYEDGVAYATAPTPANMNEKMFMLLTLAVGGPSSWPGAPNSASEFPASMKIDYVHAYATANTKYVSGTAAIGLGAPEGQGSITGEVAVGLGVGTAKQGVTLNLLNAAGTAIATTTTDVNGEYQFAYVNPGSYTVKMVTPSGYVPLAGTNGTAAVTLTAGEADTLATLKLTVSAAPPPTTGGVGGSVLLASSSGPASALAGESVTLVSSSGTIISTVTTNSSGAFAFTNVPVGYYELQYGIPTGDSISGGSVSTTGQTVFFGVTAGVNRTVGAVTLTPQTNTAVGSITGTTNLGGAPDAGVTVTLFDGSGATTLATTVTNSSGSYGFGGLSNGYYRVSFTAPSGQVVLGGGTVDPSTDETMVFGIHNGSARIVGPVTLTSASSFQDSSSSVPIDLEGDGATTSLGNGNYDVTGTASGATLTIGDGSQSVDLTGSGDTVTVGQGTSTIAMEGGNDTIHAAGGMDTISVTAGGNLLDAGPGISFLSTDGTGSDTFMLNGAAQGYTYISGYSVGVGDTLDLARTLAGLAVNSDLSNIGSFITSQVSGGNTNLFVSSNGGGTVTGFAQLTGTATSVQQLLANHEFSIS